MTGNVDTRAAEARRLAQVSAQLAALDNAEWLFSTDGAKTFVEARGRDGSLIKLLEFTGHATSDETRIVADAPAALRFLLGLVDRAISASRARRSGGAADDGRASVEASPAADGALTGTKATYIVKDDVSADNETPAARAARAGRAKDYTTEAAMRCAEPAFKRFLIDRHGLESPATDDRAAAKLRSLLGVTSRREINNSDQAVARWKQLRGAFDAWKRVG